MPAWSPSETESEDRRATWQALEIKSRWQGRERDRLITNKILAKPCQDILARSSLTETESEDKVATNGMGDSD